MAGTCLASCLPALAMAALLPVAASASASGAAPRIQDRPHMTDSVDAFHDPQLHDAIARELGPRLMREAEADQDVSVPVEDHHGIMLGWSCRVHECGENQVLWAIGRNNAVYVRLIKASRNHDFGSAPADVTRVFDAVGR